jgi:hypothetical protein
MDDQLTLNGHSFSVRIEHDQDSGPPWEEQDTLGEVTEWEKRTKHPHERILSREYRRNDLADCHFYDFAGAVRKARSEGFKGPAAQQAAEREFDYLRRWCIGEWSYVGIVVTLLDAQGEETDQSASLWGIESDQDDIHNEVALELAHEIINDINRGTYAGSTVGEP